MPNFDVWLERKNNVSETSRAISAWNRITDKPTVILVRRAVDPQQSDLGVVTHEITVRIEYDNESDEYLTLPQGNNIMGEAIVFGVRNHPSVPDTDLQRDDEFTYFNKNFRIINFTETLGELQFLAEVQL